MSRRAVVRGNKYPAPCRFCGVVVPANGGVLVRQSGEWVVEHRPSVWHGSPVSGRWVGGCPVSEPDPNDAELWCHDCRVPEPVAGWAEEAPSFRLCWDCATARAESDNGVTE